MYADFGSYSSEDYDPADLPADGCLGFVVYYEERVTENGPHYRDIITGGDWYVIRADNHVESYGDPPDRVRIDGTWRSPPDIDPGDFLIRSATTLPDDEWEKIYSEMIEAVI